MPATLTRIALRAFYDCSSLEYIKTPDAVTEIEYEAFWGCVNLKEISLSADLKTIGFSSFKYCRALKHLDCPASLTTISQYALAECTSLETVNFGESLSVIDDHAFEGCSALKGVEFPSALMKIGNSAFYGCSLIKNIDLPASINTVRAYAFLSCTALETVSIHSGSYLHFGESAFSCCPNISVVNCYNAKPTNCDSSLFSKNVYESASLNVPAGSTSLYKVTMPWYNFVSINELGCYDAALDADDAIDFNAPLEVFTLNGSKAGDTVTGLPTGTYIIRQNFCTVKYIVR